ncbi:Cytochrome b-c1 complex subunit 8 [Microtus ochrogaster]|uniref:Cytochrome b-c1 complex subunit 8 n=1 Tax=Microtus ochrogaster TaxID=79684 RepID=A0A8J6GCY9_MICOH|nr:Cytochrome b-c1 complex subunit 8 [Microtus ochrogaster]
MGREFRNLTRMRHVISYRLSPFEQRAFPKYLSKGIPKVLRRTRECILTFVVFYLIYTWGEPGQRAFQKYLSKGIPKVLRRTRECILTFVVFYLIYTWGNQEFERSRRKNPAMYENDK